MFSVEVSSGTKSLVASPVKSEDVSWLLGHLCEVTQTSIRHGVAIIIRREP